MSDREPTEAKRRPDRAALSIAVVLVTVAVFIFIDMMRLPPPGRYDPMGPAGYARLVAGVLALLAAGVAWDAMRGKFPDRERQNFLPVLFVVGGLVLQMALLKPLGFTVATGLMFAIVAYGFGERRIQISVPAGLVLAGVVWFVFARLLGLTLPEGPPERWVVETIASMSAGR